MSVMGLLSDVVARLIRQGYPETVAERIASGELPMDTASRMERARQLGFDPDDVQYHGTENYFTEFEPSPRGKMGPGVYTTPDPSLAEIHASDGQIMPLLLRGDYIGRADAFDMRPDVTGRDGQRILNETLQQAGYAGTRAGSRGSLSPETVTFDPSNIRSYYSAAFDPEYTGPNILGATATTAGALGLLAAPEEAEAGPLSILGDIPRLIDLGYLTRESAQNPSAVKSALTKYEKNMRTNKGFAYRENLAAANNAETIRSLDEFERRIVTPEDIAGGDFVLTPVRGDRSPIGLLEQVGGVPTGEVVPIQGGAEHPILYSDVGEGWRSNFAVAKGQHDKFKEIADKTGRQPLAVYNAMGLEAVNFSTPVAETMQRQMSNLRVSKRDKAKFDKELRGRYADWPGLDSDKAMDWLMGGGEFPNEGKRRTAYATIMSKGEYRDAGFPVYSEVIEATTHPALRDAEYGESGFTIYLPDVNRDVYASDVHKSYDTVMPGTYYGSLEQGVPFSQMFPQRTQSLLGEVTKPKDPVKNPPKPYTLDQAITGANIRKDGFEVADQQWLDSVMERGSADPRLLGAMGLGTAGILGAIAAGDRDDTAMAVAPRSETLQDITMGLRGVERRLEGSPAALLFPEGVVNYLETVNRPYEDPTALTRAMALLDFL